jgi:uncharacterized alkaline shock family protein YloU
LLYYLVKLADKNKKVHKKLINIIKKRIFYLTKYSIYNINVYITTIKTYYGGRTL